jgi:hypothetical protein
VPESYLYRIFGPTVRRVSEDQRCYRFFQESSEPRFIDQQLSSLDDIVITRKTEGFFTLQQTISTKATGPGHKFFGNIAVPLTANDQIVIPVGSYIIGHVLAADETGYLKGS